MKVSSLQSCGSIALEDLLIVDTLVKIITFNSRSVKFLAAAHDLLDLLFNIFRRNDVGLTVHLDKEYYLHQQSVFDLYR